MQRDYRTIFGVLLIAGGILIGLQQWGYLKGNWNDALFAGLWALGALYFFDQARLQNNPWLNFAGLVLAGLAASNLLDLFFPPIGDALGGAVFLGAIGAGFLFIFRREPSNWWALIPSGVMFTLAIISVLDDLRLDLPFETGGLLFIGIGLTFLVISQLRTSSEPLGWAIFPAGALILFGLFVSLGSAASWNYVWPVIIIVVGICLLWQSLRKS
ncbi:MAG: hypothetical protein KIT46_03375 [Anaerolineales bacterium]|nr:hypothetical protein [Anaerolineales bacterium]MCW5855067.1 hypothetical protein [Anaerolineales bacterium]